MARLQNDGRGRLGGRAKGTPNKPKQPFTEWAVNLIDKNRSYVDSVMQQPWTERATIVMCALMVVTVLAEASGLNTRTEQEQEPNGE